MAAPPRGRRRLPRPDRGFPLISKSAPGPAGAALRAGGGRRVRAGSRGAERSRRSGGRGGLLTSYSGQDGGGRGGSDSGAAAPQPAGSRHLGERRSEIGLPGLGEGARQRSGEGRGGGLFRAGGRVGAGCGPRGSEVFAGPQRGRRVLRGRGRRRCPGAEGSTQGLGLGGRAAAQGAGSRSCRSGWVRGSRQRRFHSRSVSRRCG